MTPVLFPSITPNSSRFYIGRMGQESLWAADGIIDEVAVYNHALSAAEIDEHYQRGA